MCMSQCPTIYKGLSSPHIRVVSYMTHVRVYASYLRTQISNYGVIIHDRFL